MHLLVPYYDLLSSLPVFPARTIKLQEAFQNLKQAGPVK